MENDYQRNVRKSFSNAPFRLEYREYHGNSSRPGVWQVMHQSNSAIIATGDTPQQAIASLANMAAKMAACLESING